MENQGRRLALARAPRLGLAGEEGTVHPLTRAGPPVLETFPRAASGKYCRARSSRAEAIGLALSREEPDSPHHLLRGGFSSLPS